MKKLLILAIMGLFVAACSNDFEVTAPWKEIPVVYAILSPQDTAHYIRIEKAFIDPDRSALEIAQIADSLYYPENAITVFLERVDNHERLQLHRVDGNLEGYPRESGVFATQPNWLYKVKPSPALALVPGKSYKLVIQRADGKPDITAETVLPTNFNLTKPNFSASVPVIAFTSTTPGTPIQWTTDANAYFFNLSIVVRYAERNLNGTLASTHELLWEVASNLERGESAGSNLFNVSTEIPKASFFNFLAKHMQKPAPGLYREFLKFDIIVDGGGKEIKDYIDTYKANSNITGAETFPNYTNISEGYGIFTAKSRNVFPNLKVDTRTVDSMNVSTIADTLGFRY